MVRSRAILKSAIGCFAAGFLCEIFALYAMPYDFDPAHAQWSEATCIIKDRSIHNYTAGGEDVFWRPGILYELVYNVDVIDGLEVVHNRTALLGFSSSSSPDYYLKSEEEASQKNITMDSRIDCQVNDAISLEEMLPYPSVNHTYYGQIYIASSRRVKEAQTELQIRAVLYHVLIVPPSCLILLSLVLFVRFAHIEQKEQRLRLASVWITTVQLYRH
ncbi:hypothetical protein PROFUN_03763 [Planoprotostelium fungivorum]|uniref:Uncharacterized protein n=1 Tax=Planoprotostelium fungivorum TaxID=1890364 RepID=A0A2P6NDN1_9EUKA|nr:hypothetical protein PROFUN_03763 [Planoprotostelium fungivorum]